MHFLLSIYLVRSPDRIIGAAIESLVAKDARNALGMFAHIIASPHIPTSQTSSTVIAGSVSRIPEDQIIPLMRGRFRMFNNRTKYVRNFLSSVPKATLFAPTWGMAVNSRAVGAHSRRV